MSFSFEISKELRIILFKLERKDRNLSIAVNKKIKQIIACDETSIQHFKNLKGELSDYKRVQVGSFVLVFQVKRDIIIFRRFVHHDRIYKKRF